MVSSRSQFASANWQPKNEQGCSFLGVPAVNLCSRLVSTQAIFKSAGLKIYGVSTASLGAGAVQKLQFLDSFLRFRCDV